MDNAETPPDAHGPLTPDAGKSSIGKIDLRKGPIGQYFENRI
jgi:hypothetical protein